MMWPRGDCSVTCLIVSIILWKYEEQWSDTTLLCYQRDAVVEAKKKKKKKTKGDGEDDAVVRSCVCVCLFQCLSVCLSACLPVSLSVCLSLLDKMYSCTASTRDRSIQNLWLQWRKTIKCCNLYTNFKLFIAPKWVQLLLSTNALIPRTLCRINKFQCHQKPNV